MSEPTPIYAGEAILLAWGESHRDGRTIRLKIEENGTHPFKGLDTGTERGQRFQVAIVPVNNDNSPAGAVSESKDHGDRIPKPNSTRAVMMAKDPEFWEYINTTQKDLYINDEIQADRAIKELCGVSSKTELNSNHSAAYRFDVLRTRFYAWRDHGVRQ